MDKIVCREFRKFEIKLLVTQHYSIVRHYAVDIFMSNFPVLEMPYVSCIKHAINLTNCKYDTPLKTFGNNIN